MQVRCRGSVVEMKMNRSKFYRTGIKGRQAIAGLFDEADDWQGKVIRVQKQLKQRAFQNLGVDNKIRLLNLKVWCQRYHVSLHWILETLYKKYRPGGYNLRVATMCGVRAREIIEEAVLSDFPGGENETHWRMDQRLKQAEKIVERANCDE